MAREIAVFLDTDSLTGTLGAPGKVRVYRRWQRTWTVTREMDFTLAAADGLNGLRRRMAELVAFLGECDIFVARSLSGVPYYELEKAGFSLWEKSGDPLVYLEGVWAGEEAERVATKPPPAPPVPLGPSEISPGHYFISLKEIQARNTGITTKHVLQPFLRRASFSVLEVVCNHLPPWLEIDLQSGVFAWTSEKVSEREIKVLIKLAGAG
jgi:Fe-only nitrogenase accessory protein AnfO